MNIISFKYAVFTLTAFITYWLINNKYRWAVLLIFNIAFYLSYGIKEFAVLLFLIISSFLCAILIDKSKHKRCLLVFGIVICLFPLLFYKYSNLLIDISNRIIKNDCEFINLMLPLGISFYTFEAISYLVDVYKGQKAERHIGYYACYLSLFPTIISGPIERSRNILIQLKSDKSFICSDGEYYIKLLTWGLFKKVALADTISNHISPIFSDVKSYSGLTLIIIPILFSIQIYADFSGYSDIAKGLAGLFGVKLTDNFKQPYFSKSFKEFWSRWHLSLSSWLKDYVYIPLGGNRRGKAIKYYNLLITFFISGLWHGAKYNFIIWGLLHAAIQIVEDLIVSKCNVKVSNNIKHFLFFIILNLSWVVFKVENISDILYIINPINLAKGINNPVVYLQTAIIDLELDRFIILKIALSIVVLFLFDLTNRKSDAILAFNKINPIIKFFVYTVIILIILSSKSYEGVTFIYDEF